MARLPILARLALAAGAAGLAFVAFQLYPRELPPPRGRTDLLAVVFHTPAMIFAGRLAAMSVAAFAVLSIGVRIWNREWLTKAGPFEVERAATSWAREREDPEQRLAAAYARIDQQEIATQALANGKADHPEVLSEHERGENDDAE